MYTALYTFNQVVSKRTDLKATANSMRSIIQSSFFLGFNAYAVIIIFCMTRKVMGKFYYILAAHVPAIIGSYLAIQIERPSRRSALSFYVANVAGETLFNKLVHKELFPVIPKGEVGLFAASTASLLYFMHINGLGNDPVSFGFRFLLGKEFTEAGKKMRNKSLASTDSGNRVGSGRRDDDNKQQHHRQAEGGLLVISKSQDQDRGSGDRSCEETKDPATSRSTRSNNTDNEHEGEESSVNRIRLLPHEYNDHQLEEKISGITDAAAASQTINGKISGVDRQAFVSSPDYLINDQDAIRFACPHCPRLASSALSEKKEDGKGAGEKHQWSWGVTLSSLRSLLWTSTLR